MSSWKIQELIEADYQPVMALWNSTPGVRATESPEEFSRILARNPGLSCVARDGDQLVAAILCCHDGRRGYLYHLAVAESHRRQGIARAMVDRCLGLLTELSVARCTLFVVADNENGTAY
ncbi:MAG: GNAT family N-acetyltransferase [Pirellulaceae bacterium]|nr:GNAT family N-acetyltransferase [Pirellulaceae bacterium]